ncbi:MAG: sterol desaturase family protein [Planctomycetia bacterium]|nr:sterol desaturase family protein [Planctomycetia bacterium]
MNRLIEFASSEAGVRLTAFFGVLAVMACWEAVMPRRKWTVRKLPRWTSNLSLVVLNTVVVRWIVRLTPVAAALWAHERGWGVLNRAAWPEWVKIIVGILALDLAIYLQHVMFHAVPALWRLHRVHHADLDFDVTTGLRFHTIEIVLSMLIKIGVVFVLGPSALAVLIFEVLLNATSMFNHANVALPETVDRLLRLVVVTPDMHRVHHSVVPRETNSNFGFNLPWWDFLLGTYRAQPAAGHQGMTIGLGQFRDERQADRLPGMLAMPILGTTGPYPLGSREDEDIPIATTASSGRGTAPAQPRGIARLFRPRGPGEE